MDQSHFCDSNNAQLMSVIIYAIHELNDVNGSSRATIKNYVEGILHFEWQPSIYRNVFDMGVSSGFLIPVGARFKTK